MPGSARRRKFLTSQMTGGGTGGGKETPTKKLVDYFCLDVLGKRGRKLRINGWTPLAPYLGNAPNKGMKTEWGVAELIPVSDYMPRRFVSLILPRLSGFSVCRAITERYSIQSWRSLNVQLAPQPNNALPPKPFLPTVTGVSGRFHPLQLAS